MTSAVVAVRGWILDHKIVDQALTWVDLVTAYSKRPELLHDLNETVRQLGRAQADDGNNRTSVRSVPRSTKRPRSLQDRLSDDDQRAIMKRFKAGVLQRQLAKEYGISVRSVGRLLTKWRARLNLTEVEPACLHH